MEFDPNCPERLKIFTDQHYETAFRQEYNAQHLNLKVNDSKSLYAKVFTNLVGLTDSSRAERQYLHGIWKSKYEDELHTRKLPKHARQAPKGKGRKAENKKMEKEVKQQAKLIILDARSQVIRKRVEKKLLKKTNNAKSQPSQSITNNAATSTSNQGEENSREDNNSQPNQSTTSNAAPQSTINHDEANSQRGVNESRILSSLRRCYDSICSQILVPAFKRIRISPSKLVQDIILPSQINGFAYVHRPPGTTYVQAQVGTQHSDEFLFNEAEKLQFEHLNVQRLIDLYDKKIYIFPTHECPVCKRMLYPYKHNKKKFLMQDTIRKELHKFNCSDFDDEEEIVVCSKCHYHLKKNKIPPQAYFNNVTPPEAPDCLMDLTDIELRIISQVKPHMRIFHLCRGRGQAAIKGSCIHFPQKIEEVVEQLPLTTINNDMIIVNESGHALTGEYRVRPPYIRAALLWLKENNPLYSNIEIRDVAEDDLQIHQINKTGSVSRIYDPPPPQNYAIDPPTGFQQLPNNRQILRARKSQADFNDAANQCTGMAAVAIAYSVYQNPATWTRDTIDDVLEHGNSYYKHIRDREMPENLNEDNPVLDAQEIVGEIQLFGSVRLNFFVDGEPIFGGFNKWPEISFPEIFLRLPRAFTVFIDSEYQFGIFTAGGYSIALIKSATSVFLFDSHPRTERGRKGYAATSRRQKTACIIQYTVANAAEQISELLHHNYQPSKEFNSNSYENTQDLAYNQHNDFSFVLQTVGVTPVHQLQQQNDVELSQNVHDQIINESHGGCHETENQNEQNEHDDETNDERANDHYSPQVFGNRIMVDSVIQADDFVEPEVNDFREQINMERVNLNRERGRPLYSDKHSRLEELSFVKCFPTGVYGKNEPRIAKITTLDYFQRRVMGNDPRFKTNEYLFYALAEVDKDAVDRKIAICGKMRKQGSDDQDNENPGNNLHVIDKNTAHTIMVAVRGTSSYWKKYCGDVVAMIAQLGSPHIFLTISYDDLNSHDALTAIWKSKYGQNAELPDNLTYAEKRDLLNENPVAAARHFCTRIGALIQMLKDEGEDIFGNEMTEFTYRVEFQDRGSSHIHMIIWLAKMPAWDTPEGIKFIDRNISCSLEVSFRELVEKYQSHRHTATCFKKKKGVCRFEYPRNSCTSTRLFTEEEIEKNAGRFFEIKRRKEEAFINNYHPKLLQLLRCNMDIQVVTNAKSIAYYIAKYISKAEPDECRPETRNAISEIQSDQNSSFFLKARKIATIILKQREVGAPEVGYRMCHLPLRMSSRSFVFVSTYKPADRMRMVKRDTVGTDSEKFCLNVIDRYVNRPAELINLCLLEFVAYYQPARREEEDENENEDGDNVEYRDEREEEAVNNRRQCERLVLRNGKGNIVRRLQAAIVKTPHFNPLSQKDNYYYSLLLLYKPFEVENFLEVYPSVTDAFRELKNTFRSHADDRIIRPELAQELQIALAQLLIPVQVPDNVDAEARDRDLNADVENIFEDVYEPLTAQEVFQAPNILADIENNSQEIQPEAILQRRFETMNMEQQQIYFQVQNKLFDRESPPLRLFVQGEAGCGKSYVIDTLSVLIETLNRTALNGRQTIVRAAQTGVAAKNIAGVTLHKLFSLSVERNGFVPKCKKLGGQKLQERRNVLRYVEWIVIDEISMVNYQTLQNIDSRLRDIFLMDEPFAGKNILLFGDLLQLKPVLGSWCFHQPTTLQHEINLWSLFTIYELTTVVRQRNDNLFRNLLGKLRTGDLLEADVAPLKQRVLQQSNPMYQELLSIADASLHIYPLVKQVDQYNQEKMEELKAQGNPTFVIRCIDKLADTDKYGAPAHDSYIPRDDRKCGGIPRQLQVAIGCRIMLRRNISVDGGLVNGSMGTVMKIGWAVRRDGPVMEGEQPQFIAVQFDDNVASHLLDCDGYYRVTANSFEFEGNYRHKIMRIQFPIVLCYACTVHKVQGLTLARAAIYLGIEMFTAGMAYVALSRLRSLDGLVILKLHDSRLLWTKRYMKPCNSVPYTEIIRLRIQREMPNISDKEQRDLARWSVEYPLCKLCKTWICMCVCNSNKN